MARTFSAAEALGTEVAVALPEGAAPAITGKHTFSAAEALGIPAIEDKSLDVLTQKPTPNIKQLAGQELASVVDMALSVPSMIYGSLVDWGTRIGQELAGAPHEEAAKAGREAILTYKDPIFGLSVEDIANPLTKTLKRIKAHPGFEATAVGEAIHAVMSGVETGGAKLEEHTGIPKEDVQTVVDTLLTMLAVKGSVAAVQRAHENKAIPRDEWEKGKVSEQTAEEILKDYEATGGDVRGVTTETIKKYADADINAEKTAYDLMQRGASLKETTVARKKNPLVGEKLDEMLAAIRGVAAKRLPPGQAGRADIKLLTYLGIPVTGAILGVTLDDEPLKGSIWGGLLGLGATQIHRLGDIRKRQGVLPETVGGLEYVGGVVSTRVGNVNQPFLRRMRQVVQQELGENHNYLSRVTPFAKSLNKLSGKLDVTAPAVVGGAMVGGLIGAQDEEAFMGAVGGGLAGYGGARVAKKIAPRFVDPQKRLLVEEFQQAVLTGDKSKIREALVKINDSELTKSYVEVRKVLDEVGGRLQKIGVLGDLIPDYFPRVVIDREGLLGKLGFKEASELKDILRNAESDSVKLSGKGLDAIEESLIINNYLRGYPIKGYKPGYTKPRVIKEITEELAPFYAPLEDSLQTYLRSTTKEIAKAKFFGKDIVYETRQGKKYVNVDQSAGELLRKEIEAGRITDAQAAELKSMINSYFGPGQRASSGLIQDARNLEYAGLLGNIVTAAIQATDGVPAATILGWRPMLEAMTRKLTGRQFFTRKEFGLTDHIYEEFVSTRQSAKFLNATFKTGFGAIDGFMKDTTLNAAMLSAWQKVKTSKGENWLRSRYADYFGPDYPQLLADIKAKKRTVLTDEMAFMEISNFQPISRLEVPQAFLDMPNGRYFYTLHTWQLKQMDLIRREAYNEIKKGTPKDVANGLNKLARYGLFMGIAGASMSYIQDWMMGKPIDPKITDVPINMFKTVGYSRYLNDQIEKGKPTEALVGLAVPPYKMVDQLITRDPRTAAWVPGIGKILYAQSEAGQRATERTHKREETKQRREAYGR